jgi:predicted O-methyltransferase YrrM
MIYYKIPGWFDYQDIYDFAIDKFKDGAKFVEIGGWFGRSSCYMGERIKQSEKSISLYTIDIWTHEGHQNMGHHETINERGGTMLSAFRSYMEEAGVSHIVNPIQGNSHQAHENFENESLDFIFVDGDHTWDGVKNDIVLWWPKLKPGGVMAGHDYFENGWYTECGKAVDFCFNLDNRNLAQKAHIRNGSWMMEKTLDGDFGRFGVDAMDREENQ